MTNELSFACENGRLFIETILVRELIKALVGFIMLLIYVRLIYVLVVRRRLFSNLFYKFIIINGIAYVISYVSSAIPTKYPLIVYFFRMDPRLLEEWTQWRGISIYFFYASGFAGFIGCFFMSLNRCTIICGIRRADFYWQQVFPYLVVVYVALPTLIFTGLLRTEARLRPTCFANTPQLNHYFPEMRSYPEEWPDFQNSVLAIDLVIAPFSLLVNLITVVQFWRKRHSGEASKRTVDRFAPNLFIICLCDFATHFIWLVIDGLGYAMSVDVIRDPFFIKLCAVADQSSELIALFPGMAVVACSRKIRREMFRLGRTRYLIRTVTPKTTIF